MTDEALSQNGADQQSAELKTKRTTLVRVLPTDRISFENQVELLRAFAAVFESNGRQPVKNEQAGEVLTKKLSGSTVSQLNGFFCDIGLLSRSDAGNGGFIPGAEVIEYNNACQWDESEARLKLRPVFEKTWFHRCLAPRLQLTPQPQATCLALLANESKATPEHNEKLVNLLNFLQLAGIISTAGGTVTLLQNRVAVPPDRFVQPAQDHKAPPHDNGAEKHTLYLDKDKKKTVTLTAPLAISRAEYERICKWLEVTLIVEDGKQSQQ
jgi:hypothetical protein